MSIRRSIVTLAVALSVGAAVAPITTHAQTDPGGRPVGTDTTATTRDDGPDLGWIGLAGLAGLLGLFGNRPATRREHDFAGGRTATTTR